MTEPYPYRIGRTARTKSSNEFFWTVTNNKNEDNSDAKYIME